MQLSTLFFILISSLIAVAKPFEFQLPNRQLDNKRAPIENNHYSVAQQWLLAETQAMSCAKCISLLQMLKSISHLSESMFIAAGVRICRKLEQADTDVVRNFLFFLFFAYR